MDEEIRVRVRAVVDGRRDRDGSVVGGDLGCGDVAAPVRDVDRRGLLQPDVPVDAAAGIPARGVRRVVQADGQHVGAAGPEKRREVHLPGGVTVGPAADETAVAPHGGVGHGSVDIQAAAAACVGRGHLEVLAVPADAPPRQLARLAGVLLFEGPLDAPVVRQVQRAPATVVEARLRIGDAVARVGRHGVRSRCRRGWREEAGAGSEQRILDLRIAQRIADALRVALLEAPVRVEIDPFAQGRIVGAGRPRQQAGQRQEAGGFQEGERHRCGHYLCAEMFVERQTRRKDAVFSAAFAGAGEKEAFSRINPPAGTWHPHRAGPGFPRPAARRPAATRRRV